MRRIALVLGLIFVSSCGPASVFAEDIRGHLEITRKLTKQRVALPAYEVRGVSVATHKHSETATPSMNEWDRVAIYLEGANAPAATPVSATLNQSGQRFEPEMVVVPVGSTVSFPNSDPIFHNVFSLSKARQFDLGFYPAGQTRTVKFDKPGIVQVYCHLHPDMSAAIFVAPNGWYVRPNKSGDFSFADIPPGTYQVVVWHKSAGLFRKRIQVLKGGAVNVSMEIPLAVDDQQP